MIYFIISLGFLFFVLILIVGFTVKNGISPMPTSTKVREALFKYLPPLKNGIVVDLGSGWGHLIFPLSKHYPTCEIFGFETSPVPYLFSSMLNYYSNVKIVRRDFFKIPLDSANLIVCYLYPKGMKKLKWLTKLKHI